MVKYQASVRMSLFTLLWMIILDAILSQTDDDVRIVIEFETPSNLQQNDIIWTLESVTSEGSSVLLDSGDGINNMMKSNLKIKNNVCLRYNITDSFGDGGGEIYVYFGETAIDNHDATFMFLNDAKSQMYLKTGKGPEIGSASHLIQYGIGILGSSCEFEDITPNIGCHEVIAVDVIFVLDTSSDLMMWCQHYYSDIVIDLIEHYLPRDDLQISIITYGTDDTDDSTYKSVINTVTGDNLETVTFTHPDGSWYSYLKPIIEGIGSTQCIGGGHSTIQAFFKAIDIYFYKYGTSYDLTRQQYVILFTNEYIDDEQTKHIYECGYWPYILDSNGIKFILFSEKGVNQHLQCLNQRPDNIITIEYFAQMLQSNAEYELIEDLVCSSKLNIAITEVFIDDINDKWWFEIVNLGVAFNISSLECSGNLFVGNIDLDDTMNQGDIFVIGNMQRCDFYDVMSYQCDKYYAVNYDGTATLSSFFIGVNDMFDSVFSVSSLDDFVIEPGYSYELSLPYSDFTDVSNWRESCHRYGSPGVLNDPNCPSICDAVKCTYYGDTTSHCNESISSICICGIHYYYDADGTRSCIDVEKIPQCLAYVIDHENAFINVSWSESSYPSIDGYTIKYGTESTQNAAQYTIITFPQHTTAKVRMIVIGTDISDDSYVESIEQECGYDYAPTKRPTYFDETYTPSTSPTKAPVTTPIPSESPTAYPTYAGCGSSLSLDLLFILDSSGSIRVRNTWGDARYANWYAEIDFCKAIVNGSLPGDTRVGTIIFAGCGEEIPLYDDCFPTGDLGGLEWGLTQFGSPNDQDAVYQRFLQMGSGDFIGMWTWTREALKMAIMEFNASSTADRSKMIILLTDGYPEPAGDNHNPCLAENGITVYISPELAELRRMEVDMLLVGIGLQEQYIDDYFKCMVENYDEQFFEAVDFDALGTLVDAIGKLVCSKDINIMINEVGLMPDYNGTGKHLYFVELYNSGVGVSLDGFELRGMINYVMSAETVTPNLLNVNQGQYWVISTYDMSTIDQSEDGCRGCDQNLLIDPSNADGTMDNNDWTIGLYNALGELVARNKDGVIQSIERDVIYFPLVKDGYTHELKSPEQLDNTLGGNWEESCYVYGTPQSSNIESCPCSHLKCKQKGDKLAYCDDVIDLYGNSLRQCLCSDNYILSGGVCIPIFAPGCCFTWESQCAQDIMLITWCTSQSSAVVSYRIDKDGVEFDTVGPSVNALNVSASCVGQLTPNFTVSTIYQTEPLIQSSIVYCPPTVPTSLPTSDPTQSPSDSTDPTESPTLEPTTIAPTTLDPTAAPTPFGCDKLTIIVKDDPANPYPPAVVDLRGTYTVESTAPDLKHWKWQRNYPLTANDVIQYVDALNAWIISSSFTYLVYPAPNDSSVVPPYTYAYNDDAWSNWTDTFTGLELQLMLLCKYQLWDTPHPTPAPATEVPQPLPNCTHLIGNTIGELRLTEVSHDGRGIWINDNFEIAWYDRINRWTLYDIADGTLYLAPVSYSSYPEPFGSDVWISIEDENDVYSLNIACEYNMTTTTPAPTSLICEFPDGVLKHWPLSALDTWKKCYYTTYSDGTTSSTLQHLCVDEIKKEFNNDTSQIYLFVGAINEDDLESAMVGSYAHISVLETQTASETRAEQTSISFPQQTWWYYVEGVAFGFSDQEKINLADGSCDAEYPSSDRRMCWHLRNLQTGGWRAGRLIDLNHRNDIYKVIYYKQCNVTIPLTICSTITVDDNIYYGELHILKDYGVINDDKFSWQQDNEYELGWMEVEKAWLLDTVSVDGETWLYKDPNPDPDFPPFGEELTFFNRNNDTDTIELILRCGEEHNETLFASEPPSDCDCINIITDGLSAINGYYNYSLGESMDGGNYYGCDSTRLYFDTNLETWFIVGNGAYFELIPPFTLTVDNPTQVPPLDSNLTVLDRAQSTSYTAQIRFECSITCSCTSSSSSTTCEPYADSEIIYTSVTQMGFPIIPTDNEERYLDGFLYSRHYDESILQLSISDYILPGSIELQRPLYPPNTMKMVYDRLDSNIYRDSNIVGLWFQLFDAYDSTYLDLSNVMVYVFAECPDCIQSNETFAECPDCIQLNETLFNETCDTSSIDEHSGFTQIKCEFVVDESLFVKDYTNILQVYGELYVNDILMDISDTIELTLSPRIEAEGIDYAGIYGEFTMSPRYETEEVRLTLWLNSGNQYAQAWWLSVTFDNSVIKYIGFIAYDELWGSVRALYTVDVSNNKGEIEIWGSKFDQSLNTNGADIYVGYFLFEVIEGTKNALYRNVLSFRTLSMSGDNAYAITNNVEGLMADIDGWSTTQASLLVIPDDPIDIFVEVDTNNLWNTAFLSGITVSIPFPVFVVYHSEIRKPTSLSCAVENAFLYQWYPLTQSGSSRCIATATADQDESGNSYMNITADNIKSAQSIVVWLPLLSSFEIVPWNTGTKTKQTDLAQVNMPYRAVGDIYYESVPLYVYCNFTNKDIRTTRRVGVNEFIINSQFEVQDGAILEIHHYEYSKQRFLMHGLSAGSTAVNLTLPIKQRVFASQVITVGNHMVDIVSFGGILVTHSEFKYTSHVVDVDQNAPALEISTNLELYITNAGGIASVHPFMKLSDGVLVDLTDNPDIEYTSAIPEYLSIINVDKTDGQNMDEPGAYAQITDIAEPVPWDQLVIWNWPLIMTNNGMIRSRGIGCISGRINETLPLRVNVGLSCGTRSITRIEDPAYYIFGIPAECYLMVEVHWSDGSTTDLSTNNRTKYEIITDNNLLILYENMVRVNTSCDPYTTFIPQNTDCYGFSTVEISLENYPSLANWTESIVQIEFEVVMFDRLRLVNFPAPYYDSSYDPPMYLNLFYCSPEYEQSKLRIWGNLTNGAEQELTDRSDVILTETNSSVILLQNSLRLVSGKRVGDSSVIAALRDEYTSNTVYYIVTNDFSHLDKLELYTFLDSDHVFEDLIHSKELLKMDAIFSDGVMIKDILNEMLYNGVWSDSQIPDLFSFSSTDPNVVSVDENGYIEILDNWWREINITVKSNCSDANTSELIYPNLKPDLWDVDVEKVYSVTGLQFENQDINDDMEPFLWNVYINASTNTLLSFSIRLWWNDDLFIGNGTDNCSTNAWPQCKASGDWEGQMLSWNIDTVRGELRLAGASSSDSSTNNALQLVATCNFRVRSTASSISRVIGQIIEITYMDDDDFVIKHIYNKEIVAGVGYQQINDGQTIQPLIISMEPSIIHDCSGVFGDVNYDCKHTAFDAQAISYYFVDTTAPYPNGFSTIPLDDLAWSQRIAMDLSLDYLQKGTSCALISSVIPCPQGLEDIWYSLQISTAKFLYMNVTNRTQTLEQNSRIVRAIAPMFIQESASVFRSATDLDCTVFFELKDVTEENQNAFIRNNSLAIGELVPVSEHGIVDSIIIKGEYIDNKYWSFETNEHEWTDIDGCFKMAILYETLSEVNCTQMDRQYAFRGTSFYGDSFVEFTELCVDAIKNTKHPTTSPTQHPTANPTYERMSPEIDDCRYEDHGTAILAFFSQDTNRAGFGGKAFSCAAVWNVVSFNNMEGVTQDSRCIWKDFKTLRIELGYDFTPIYRLALVGTNIRDYAELYPPTKGYCFVHPMFNPPPVFASIIGSTHLGSCDDIRLLGSPTTGQSPPMTWKWKIEGAALQNDCVLGSQEIPDDEEVLFVPNRCLIQSDKEEISFYIFLDATNYHNSLTSSTYRTVIMYPQSDALPSIQLLTPTAINITTIQDLVIPTFVSVASGADCDPNDVVFDVTQFTFSWSSLRFEDLLETYDPFGSAFSNRKNEMDTESNINSDNFVYLDLSSDVDIDDTSATLIIPGYKFESGKYYAFKLSVQYSNGNSNKAFVGVVVNLPIPYPRPSIKYQVIREKSDITLDINDFYDFYGVDASNYGIEWECFYANSKQSIFKANDETVIVMNELNADLYVNNTYNCSAHLFSKERNTYNMTWGRQESYYVFEYISDDLNDADLNKLISVHLTTNIGIINRNKRIVISATLIDYNRNINTFENGLEFDELYIFEWSSFTQNSDLLDTVYGISVIDHIDYAHGNTVNFVIDDQVNEFIFDGQKYGLELKVTYNGSVSHSGYGQIELIANRGPNGGQCVIELINDNAMLYRVECYAFTDEYIEMPLEYNFMLLDSCDRDSDCKDELICDTESSEYDVGVCVLATVGPVQPYLREWTQGNVHYFRIKCDSEEGKNYILRSFIRDFSGFVTTFDTPFSVEGTDSNSDIDTSFLDGFDRDTFTGFAQYMNAYDELMDCAEGEFNIDRTDVVEEISSLYYKTAAQNVNKLLDPHNDLHKMFSTHMDALFYDHEQFDGTNLEEKTLSQQNIALRIFAIIDDMTSYFNNKYNNQMIPRDLAVYQIAAMTWSGDASLQQESLNTREFHAYFSSLKFLYTKYVLEINNLGLNERLIDETHFNLSYNGLTILSGWETVSKLYSGDSDCGGDLIDLAPDFQDAYVEVIAYVKCELILFNGGVLNPTAIAPYMSSPIVYWNLRAFTKDGTEVAADVNYRRRRGLEYSRCSPFIYSVPHNLGSDLISYAQRRATISTKSYVPWSVCKSILNDDSTDINDDTTSYSEYQAPNADDCYVLTHDDGKTVCACNSNYTLVAIEEKLYYPQFIASLNRYNPDFTWTGLMESVGAMIWLLILSFVFTFAFYILPTYDKHKALLAVKKGLPKSQRSAAYFQTAEGKVYRAAHININRLSFCAIYAEVYRIRLRNDHLCLWWCCDDPGSNISHFIKVLLSLFYCLLFMFEIAWFYAREYETVFPDTLFAFLVAFETILPIWIFAWCISKIRPHEFTDQEIDEIIEVQMPIITKDQKWDDEYESDVQIGDDDEENEEFQDIDGDALFDAEAAAGDKEHDILRLFTDIDEEIEYLEENFMPDDTEWKQKNRVNIGRIKVSYIPMDEDIDEDIDEESSVESYEERKGFEAQNYMSHWNQARDAVKFGFIPVNEGEEYDAVASKMLHQNPKPDKRKMHAKQASITSKISSIFKKKEKGNKKQRQSSLMKLLSFGSKEDVLDVIDDDDIKYDNDDGKAPTIASMNAPKPMLREIELEKEGNGIQIGAKLRNLQDLPSQAPSQRPKYEKKTNIDDDVWDQSLFAYGERDVLNEDHNRNDLKYDRGIDMEDIWEITGALPPELLAALDDPYDAWKEDDEVNLIQKVLHEDEEDQYRDKLTMHFEKRRQLLKRRYWLPRWCRYIVWLILIFLIILFAILFLFEGNKLGAAFLWVPQSDNSTECVISITEQHRFDYDYSLDESFRRNPGYSPVQCKGSMPNEWDYRNRFTVASIITLLTSVILVQPFYIAILALIAVTCLPMCRPHLAYLRNCCCGLSKDDAGYKEFVGGAIVISGDTNLEYGHFADQELTQFSLNNDDDDQKYEAPLLN